METTQEHRRHAGTESIAALFGGHAADQVVAGLLAQHGSLGSYAVDVLYGELWPRPQLAPRDRHLIVVGLLGAMRSPDLADHVALALDGGLDVDEVREVAVLLSAYAGFPAALAASQVISTVVGGRPGVAPARQPVEAEAKDDEQRRADGAAVFHSLTRGRSSTDPETAFAGVAANLGDLGRQGFHWIFGELWARPQLSRRDRSLVVVAVLTLQGSVREMRTHVPAALHHGVTRDELIELMLQAAFYIGFPLAVEGVYTARECFALIDEEPPAAVPDPEPNT